MRPLNPMMASLRFRVDLVPLFLLELKLGARGDQIIFKEDIVAEENKREVRLSVRVPQPLKDKIVAEAGRMGLSQSEFVRYVMMTYFAEKERK
jgi:hypothetical protein